MVISLALVATGVALTTLMTASWQLALLWGVVVGLGTGTMASVLGAMVANRWFTERRGVVLGLLTASAATGQLLFLPCLLRWWCASAGEAPCCWWQASRSSFCRWWPC
jgi:MFS family permease